MGGDPHRLLLKEIVDVARALSGGQRSQYLDEHCLDAGMRAEVESLLREPQATVVLEHDFSGFPSGALLGHYRIHKKLGQGGMGWVYEATDEKLHRTVAIKVLPPGQISEGQRKRFAREAQSASALNHPNIVTIYEIGREGEIDYIAMERIAGRTLREEIVRGNLDPCTALRYAIQIAAALAAAHEAGIIHRDLKPGNVMATDRGLVKVLDFGLAKQGNRPAWAGDATETLVTEVGGVVGTLYYMSPEQAEGDLIDTRSDIFSFGSVLFEMMTGRRAFRDTGAARQPEILNQEPPLAELPTSLPSHFRLLLEKCLKKKPADRWQHIGDVKLQLEDLVQEMESPRLAPGTPPARRFGWVAMLSACLGAALLTAAIFRIVRGPVPEPSSPLVLRMLTADNGLSSFPAISRDGKLLAFASDRGNEGNLDIWLQQIDGRDPIRLTKDPADEIDPAFSPDGTRVAYRSEANGGGIYVAPAIGTGQPVLLAAGGRNPRFSPDGRWIAYWVGREFSFVTGGSRLFVVEAGGGEPRQIHPEMAAAMYPAWSPRGDELIVLGRKEGPNLGMGVMDWWILPMNKGIPKSTGAIRQLRDQGLLRRQLSLGIAPTVFDWTGGPTDRLLFAAVSGDSANLWELELSSGGASRGPAKRLTQGPGRQARAARATLESVERTVFSDEVLNFDIWTIPMDADAGVTRGKPSRITTDASPEWAPSITWDGRKLAYITRHGGIWSLRSRDLVAGVDQALIFNPGILSAAKYSGQGNRVLYSNEDFSLYAVPANGGAAEKLCDRCGTVTGASGDGSRIAYEPMENEDIMVFDSAAGKSRKIVLRPEPDTVLSGAQFSRDGKWVAFHSLRSHPAVAQIWVAPANDAGVSQAEWIAVTDGKALDKDPYWAPGAGLIYFLSERDGFGCIWARHLEAATKKPSGESFAVQHFHSGRQSLRRVGAGTHLTGLSVGSQQLVFALSDLSGNVWLAEAARTR